jgi:3-hydroxybutyryl-CoA dehydrogenase
MTTTITKVGILGCGQMGAGIAEVCVKAGFRVMAREVERDFLDRGLARVRSSLERSRDRDKLTSQECDAALERLSGTLDVADLADCDLVIEAIVEDLAVKQRALAEVDEVLPAAAILATNTSSLTVTELAMSTSRPDRFVGLHFFNPVPVMRLVEVIRTLMVQDDIVDLVVDFCGRLDKEPIRCRDNSGFIVNRLLVPYLLDAIRAYEEGIGTLEEIDTGMRLGCGHPMGPFTLLDFIGLDTCYFIANIMFDEYREKRFAPPPLLKQMVQAGRLGRKSGEGFFSYS